MRALLVLALLLLSPTPSWAESYDQCVARRTAGYRGPGVVTGRIATDCSREAEQERYRQESSARMKADADRWLQEKAAKAAAQKQEAVKGQVSRDAKTREAAQQDATRQATEAASRTADESRTRADVDRMRQEAARERQGKPDAPILKGRNSSGGFILTDDPNQLRR